MKKTALLTAALIAVALFCAVPAFPGTVPSSVVPEGARWVAHLDMEKFVGTSLYSYLEKSGAFEIKKRDLSRWPKIDIPKDVTGVTLFGLGDGTKDQVVVAVAGRFDKPALLALLAQDQDHKEIPYGAATIYSTGDTEFGAFVNDNLVVLSESQAGIEKALDTAAGKSKNFSGTALSASLKEVPSGAFLGGVLPDLSGLGREFGQSKMLDSASGLFFLAQEKQDNLLVRVQLTAASPESAKNMADIANGLVAMGRMGAGQSQGEGGHAEMAQMISLLDGLKIQQDGKVIKLDFERSSKEIADLISHRHELKGLLD